ncbi:MAG: hypothetical protein DRN90_07980 [Thermoproteota archaeon]|nr:MAG: hypothetical protein DRN90_07980 [Candidatus Korarchaeota archaeon]
MTVQEASVAVMKMRTTDVSGRDAKGMKTALLAIAAQQHQSLMVQVKAKVTACLLEMLQMEAGFA